MNNSQLLKKVSEFLRNKKAGKKINKQFADFIRQYEDLKQSFHSTFPEK
jgi:hypothetical protein